MSLTCNALNGVMGKYLNWCAVANNPLGNSKMFPGEVWMLIPSQSGTSLVVENRFNAAHSIPACFNTSLISVINATVSVDPTSGGQVLEASWTRPRYLTDPGLLAEGHTNLTGSKTGNGAPLGTLISAASQAPNTAYAPCDVTQLKFHSWFNTGVSVDWDQ